MIKVFEYFAGVMIGREIIFKKIAQSGKQIIGITTIQALGTFLFVTLVFAIAFLIARIPVYLAFVFGGIALATAPVLSVVGAVKGGQTTSIFSTIGIIIFPFVIGIISGLIVGFIIRKIKNKLVDLDAVNEMPFYLLLML